MMARGSGGRASRLLAASAYVVVVTVWAVWVAWLPVRLAAGPVTGATAVAAALTYRTAGFVCHQHPERSFHGGPWAWPVCARCAGLYAGAAGGGVAALAVMWWRGRGGANRVVSLSIVRLGLLAAAVPTAFLWATEWIGGVAVSNLARWFGALPLGAAVSALIVLALLGRTVDGQAPRVWSTLIAMVARVTKKPVSRPGPPRALVYLAAWLVPGLGHLWLGRRDKGLVFLVAVPAMFAVGLFLQGRLFPFVWSEPLVALAAVADVLCGVPYFVARALDLGAGQPAAVGYEYGNAFLITSGLLNALVVIDAHDIALGRK